MTTTTPIIGFLFNHEQKHQILHVTPIINALAEIDPPFHIAVFAVGNDNAAFVSKLLNKKTHNIISFHILHAPHTATIAAAIIGNIIPLARLAILWRERHRLGNLSALIVPEATSAFLKTRLGYRQLRLFRLFHGAGDRLSHHINYHCFDHVLVPSQHHANRLSSSGKVSKDRLSVIGYPKFDAVNLNHKPILFRNNNPVILYNPHYHPRYSSWFDEGLAVLDFFRQNPNYNLIFAPHVMLFARRFHISLDSAILRRRRPLPQRFYQHPNILIDTKSIASIDMTYTRSADIYLGDISSQIYEFLYQPKPCLFINKSNLEWRNNPNLAHWHLGPVLNSAAELESKLADCVATPPCQDQYTPLRRDAFRNAFNDPPTGGAVRAAAIIKNLIAPAATTPIS